MKYILLFIVSLVGFSGTSHAQCSGFDRNLERALGDYRYYGSQHPIVSSAFDDVMGEIVKVLQETPRYWNNPDDLTFTEIAPALGSLIAFAIVCDMNQPHCDRYIAKIDPVVTSIMVNLGSGYAASCWR